MRAVEQVRAFIAEHGNSRFEKLVPVAASNEEISEDRTVIHRAGWKRQTNEGWEFLFTSDCWKDDVCRGLNPKHAAEAVDKAGFLVRGGDGRLTAVQRIGPRPRDTARVYVVRGAILGGDDDGK